MTHYKIQQFEIWMRNPCLQMGIEHRSPTALTPGTCDRYCNAPRMTPQLTWVPHWPVTCKSLMSSEVCKAALHWKSDHPVISRTLQHVHLKQNSPLIQVHNKITVVLWSLLFWLARRAQGPLERSRRFHSEHNLHFIMRRRRCGTRLPQ